MIDSYTHRFEQRATAIPESELLYPFREAFIAISGRVFYGEKAYINLGHLSFR